MPGQSAHLVHVGPRADEPRYKFALEAVKVNPVAQPGPVHVPFEPLHLSPVLGPLARPEADAGLCVGNQVRRNSSS